MNGIYKIDIEMSAHKQVDGLLNSANRLLAMAGAEVPAIPLKKKQQIAEVVQMFTENQDVFDAFTMEIEDDRIIVQTDEGEMVYCIKSKQRIDEMHVVLQLDEEEMGEIAWNVTLVGTHLLLESEDELSEYVFVRQ